MALLAAAFCVANASAQTAIPPDAADFALSAIQSDEYEIRAAEAALAESKNPQLRAFAQQLGEPPRNSLFSVPIFAS